MTLILCLDDRGGMSFNRRRQSRDAAILEDIRASLTGPLLVTAYSVPLLEEAKIPWALMADPLPEEGQCFPEIGPVPQELLDRASALVIYRWNRLYPSDVLWDTDPASLGFVRTQTLEFAGRSHERITKEVYTK